MKYNTAQDFWNKADIGRPDECWKWTASLTKDGYGSFKMNKQWMQSHRWATIFDGRDPTGKVVMHTCDNPACVNPAHLIIGTQQDNIKDMHNKGRYRSKQRKLSDIEIRAIRMSELSYVKIGQQFDISNNYAWKIKQRIAYKDVI